MTESASESVDVYDDAVTRADTGCLGIRAAKSDPADEPAVLPDRVEKARGAVSPRVAVAAREEERLDDRRVRRRARTEGAPAVPEPLPVGSGCTAGSEPRVRDGTPRRPRRDPRSGSDRIR